MTILSTSFSVIALANEYLRRKFILKQIIVVLHWSACSVLCSGSLVYIGANTERYQEKWPLACLTGAVVGAVGGLLASVFAGDRRGVRLVGLLFGVVQGMISANVLWGLK